MKTYKLFNIYYDTDGENVELPNEIKVIENDDWNVELEGSDRISDLTGWCVFGFEYEISDVSNN